MTYLCAKFEDSDTIRYDTIRNVYMALKADRAEPKKTKIKKELKTKTDM